MKYIVTATERIGSHHTIVGEFEAKTGQDAIKQAEKVFQKNWKSYNWFATPCFEYETGKEFYKWGRE